MLKHKAILSLLAVLALGALAGCGHKKTPLSGLPLPPLGDSGVADGWYYQSEYGFGVPMPKGYAAYAPMGEDDTTEDFDEWVRFTNPKRDAVIRVFTQSIDEGKRIGAAGFQAAVEKVFETGEYKIIATGKAQDWPAGENQWHVMTFDLKDKVQKEWRTWACAIPHEDFVVWVRVTMPKAAGAGPKGDKMLAQVKELLPQLRWYRPVGPRGISLEQYELTRFTNDFNAALVSGSVNQTLEYFDDTSAERIPWADWYKQLVGADAKGNAPAGVLKAEPSGLVINGASATAFFTIQAKGTASQRVGFKLSKSDGTWQIVSREKDKE